MARRGDYETLRDGLALHSLHGSGVGIAWRWVGIVLQGLLDNGGTRRHAAGRRIQFGLHLDGLVMWRLRLFLGGFRTRTQLGFHLVQSLGDLDLSQDVVDV